MTVHEKNGGGRVGAGRRLLSESPGTIALPTTEIGRFTVFTVSLVGTVQPPGSYLDTKSSASVVQNLNSTLRELRPDHEWVWIIGDDHVWPNDTLMRLLTILDNHPDIDLLVPLVAKRNPPWPYVLFREAGEHDDGTPRFTWLAGDEIPETGVFDVDAAGSAGMLIRRHVIDAMDDPWFYSTADETGRVSVINEDVAFCLRARHEHGFRLCATADVTLGHIGVFNVRPFRKDGRWGSLIEYSATEDRFRHMFMPAEAVANA